MTDNHLHDEEPEGYIGGYGVLIVPPESESGGWLVSVAGWDSGAERYVTTGEGPIFETRAEATAEAERVIDWLGRRDTDLDPAYVWQTMQRARAAEERGDDRPKPWGRF
jgi:hypothetical protein